MGGEALAHAEGPGMSGLGEARWIVDSLATALKQSIEGMSGEGPQIAANAHDLSIAPAYGGDYAWWRQSFSLSEGSSLWIGAPEETWSSIGATILKAAGIDDGDRDSIRSTFAEIVGQTMSGVAHALSTRFGREVTTAASDTTAPGSPLPEACFDLTMTVAEPAKLALAVVIDRGLPEAVDAQLGAQENEESAPAPTSAPPARVDSDEQALRRSRKMDLLLDVELPVSVSFGRAQLLLKDIIKLNTGSIIELNRSVSEPVEVIVNNCVIARGEVVVVEGNFGVRVHEVVSRQERLRTLR